MGDDPRKNLQWLQRQLLEEEDCEYAFAAPEDTDLLIRADRLLEEDGEEILVRRGRKRPTAGERAEEAHQKRGPEENAAVFVKTKKQLRREAKRKKNVNRKLADLVILAVLEIIGILCILGWWLQ